MISQKCQYALRAVFELAKHSGEAGHITIGQIAENQAIPPRFLEVILGQLKQAGFVESRRGSEGGYRLSRHPAALSVGEVMRFVEGPLSPVGCITGDAEDKCELRGTCVFEPMWRRVKQAVSDIYDNTTFQDLIEQEARMRTTYAPAYAI